MKKLLLSAFALMMGMGMMKAQNVTYTALVYVNNPSTTTTAYQCDVVIPSGMSVTTDSEKTVTKTGSCDETFVVAGNTIDGIHRIVNYSNSNTAIAKAGSVAQFTVTTPTGYVSNGGSFKFTLVPENTEVVNSSSEKENTPSIVVRLKGDVSGDGKLNAADYGQVLSAIKKNNGTMYSDVTCDGKVNAADYGFILNAIKNSKK